MRVTVHLRRHSSHRPDQLPTWIRRDAVTKILGPPAPEALAELRDHRGERVGLGMFSPDSDIPVRVLCRGDRELPEDWLSRRVHQALEAREHLGIESTTGYREINAEGDGLPGLTVDRYGTHRVIQMTTASMLARREEIAAALRDHTPRPTIWTVPEAAARRESIPALCEGDPTDVLSFREYGLDLETTPPPSQKTGAYHDQRENRRRVASLAAAGGGRVLDLGCHLGGFSLHAARAGLSCVAVDRSDEALSLVRRNADANGLEDIETLRSDIFGHMDEPALSGPFGAIIFDPPKVAASGHQAGRATKAMGLPLRRLIPRLSPGGLLVVCSCSYNVGPDAVRSLVARVSVELGVRLPRLEHRGPGPDHPTCPHHVEGNYLSVTIFRRADG